MDFDIEYVLNKYEMKFEFSECNEKYVLYPSNSNVLIVCFSTLGANIYERLRLFWNQNEIWEYNFLFVSDNNGIQGEGLYYIGDTKEQKVEKLTINKINKIIVEKNIEQVITLGSSMGGYAAIYYAKKYNYLGAISIVPQVNIEIINEYGWEKWKNVAKTINGDGLPNLIKCMKRYNSSPYIYIQSGEYKPDVLATNLLINSLKKNSGVFIVDKFDEKSHTSAYMNRDLIYAIINLYLTLNDRPMKIGGVN